MFCDRFMYVAMKAMHTTSMYAIENTRWVSFDIKQKGGKDQETIQSSTTPDPGYHMGK